MAADPLFVQGVLKIMGVFLALVAGVLCVRLLWRRDKNNRAWTFLVIALLIFAFGEIMGTLDAFGVLNFTDFLPGIELGVVIFVILALFSKLNVTRGEIV